MIDDLEKLYRSERPQLCRAAAAIAGEDNVRPPNLNKRSADHFDVTASKPNSTNRVTHACSRLS
jgi:hypothetical protein